MDHDPNPAAIAFMTFPIAFLIAFVVIAVVRTRARMRLLELMQRERIAAIERGIDVSKLPPLPLTGPELARMSHFATPRHAARHRAQGLLISGVLMIALAVGLGATLLLLAEHHRAAAAGLVPLSVGVALLLSSWIVRSGSEDDAKPPQA